MNLRPNNYYRTIKIVFLRIIFPLIPPFAFGILPSAQLAVLLRQKRKISARKKLNDKGPNKEPCGTPRLIFLNDDILKGAELGI